MTSDASVRSAVERVHIAEAGGDHLLKVDISAGVKAQPVFSGAVTGFATDPAVWVNIFG